MKLPIPEVIKEFSLVFERSNFKLYAVGGAVRDYVLGIENHDWDFTTNALPGDIQTMFHSVIPTGIKHGTVTVLYKGNSFEVTTFRTESAYSDKRHPDYVNYTKNLAEDLSRRDFTVNALAADCSTGEITDLFDGEKDLKNHVIRAIGNPEERFEEDALRLMRMCRFCAKLNFEPEAKTLEAAKKLSANISWVSQERIFEELRKTLESDLPHLGIKLMSDCHLLEHVLPEVDVLKTIEQTKVNASDVFEHTLIALKAAAEYRYSSTVRLALLLHDIGKYPTKTINQYGILRFPNHDYVGGQMAEDILKRLKCSNQLIADTTVLISNHMVKYSPDWTDGAVKRFINRVGKENINPLFELQWCDQIASEGKSKADSYDEFISRIKEAENQPMKIQDLAITGKDLSEIGIPKDKTMGLILNELLEMIIDYPLLNNRETLLNQASVIFKSKF